MSQTRKSLVTLLLGAALSAALTARPAGAEAADQSSGKEVAVPRSSPSQVYSPAVRVGDLVFLAGQLGLKPGTRDFAGPGIEAQTRQALENVRAILEKLELGMEDVAKCSVFLAEIGDFAAMNGVYRQFFPEDPPARTTVAVSGLALSARIEIECIAAAP